ncbi:hypothetical protein PFISCL1PPCAC_22552, partial [Pristionchus fissidentatus]
LSIAEEWASLVASTGPIDNPLTPTISFLEAAETFLHNPIHTMSDVDPKSDVMHEVDIPDAPIQNEGFDHNESSIPVETPDEIPSNDDSDRFNANFHADCDLTTGDKEEEGDRSESEDSTSEDDSKDEDYVEKKEKEK